MFVRSEYIKYFVRFVLSADLVRETRNEDNLMPNSEKTIGDNRVFAEQSSLQIYRGIRSKL